MGVVHSYNETRKMTWGRTLFTKIVIPVGVVKEIAIIIDE